MRQFLDAHTPPRPPAGRILLAVFGLGLVTAGATALILAAVRPLLPHDEAFLGLTATDLCARGECRIVHFMAHDRAAFGGAVAACGLVYLWLVSVPLRGREWWAWWTLLTSGSAGFAGFLAFFGFGYFDPWHAAATVVLLVPFAIGLVRSRRDLARTPGGSTRDREPVPPWRSSAGLGRVCLVASSAGMAGAGAVILGLGTTTVFVPQDLGYLGADVADLTAISPRLVPLIAHDRAGFGGALLACGLALTPCTWRGLPSRSLWWVLLAVGAVGFGPALGVHFAVGYTDPVHLAPAIAGAAVFALGLAPTHGPRIRPGPATEGGRA